MTEQEQAKLLLAKKRKYPKPSEHQDDLWGIRDDEPLPVDTCPECWRVAQWVQCKCGVVCCELCRREFSHGDCT